MDSPTNFNGPYMIGDGISQLNSCIALRKTLILLGSRNRPSVSKCEDDFTKSCLQWLRQWGNLNLDDSSLVDVLYEVITQYIFQKIPKGYHSSDFCLLHHYYCHCIVERREHYVVNQLRELGVDVGQFRPQIDAAFIMTMENNSTNVPFDVRSIDQPPRRNVPPLIRRRKAHRLSHFALRIGCSPRSQPQPFSETRNRVIVEYLPKSTQNFRGLLKPGNNKEHLRRLTGEFEEGA